MADTINLPKIGPVKKSYVYAGGAAVAGYVAWRWWQSGVSASGTGEEEAAEVAPAPESIGTIGADIGSGSGGYYYPRPEATGDTDEDPGDTVINNMQWSARALEWLVNAGYAEKEASNALGKYLASQHLSASEQVMIQVAMAFVGRPPHEPEPPVTTTPPEPSAVGTPQNLRGNGTPTTSAVPLRWDAVGGAAGYNVYRDGSLAGSTTGTAYTASGLASDRAYTFTVRAKNSAGTTGPASNSYTGRTAKPSEPKPTTPSTPAYRVAYITKRGQTLSDLVAANNKKYGGANPSWQDVYNFNLKYRSKSSAATIRSRGPHKTYIGSSWWIPK